MSKIFKIFTIILICLLLGWLFYPNYNNETNFINKTQQKAVIREEIIILIFDLLRDNLQLWVKSFTQVRELYIDNLEQDQKTPKDKFALPKENKQQIIHHNFNFLQGQIQFLNPVIQKHIKNWKSYDGWPKISELYKDLNDHHDFIQWFFPNFFKSQYNHSSHRLTIEERNLIIQDEKAKNTLKDFYLVFLHSIGIKCISGELIVENMGQFVKCFSNGSHIFLRIQRLLASLSVLGFRDEALKLIHFLNQSKLEYPTIQVSQFKDYGQLKEESIATNQQENQKQLSFNDVKFLYVQQDLLNEKWVTPKLLTAEIIEL